MHDSPWPWLTDERDACGVGFIADRRGRASHAVVSQALAALTCLEHRGGCSADRDSGDGSGVLTGLPWDLLQAWAEAMGLPPLVPGRTGVGMVFLPPEAVLQAQAWVTQELQGEGFMVLGWRPVPVRPEVLGVQARENCPAIAQVVVAHPDWHDDRLEQQLYLARKRLERQALQHPWGGEFYVCSLSGRTLVYKGMVRAAVLGEFYVDLQDARYQSSFAIYHRRFSTNTMPKWPLAQPMRLLGHNGEINTLLGNINWMVAREASFAHPAWDGRLEDLRPVVNLHNSDSANLDSSLELLVRSGRSPLEAMMLLIPEAYRQQPELADYPEVVDFYEYYAGLQEPWDGPALIVFGDGQVVGATLDRNGLRPARYVLTDDWVIVASEAGVVEVPPQQVLAKGRLGPGQMLAVDLVRGELLTNWTIKQRVAQRHPYGVWVKQYRRHLDPQPFIETCQLAAADLLRQQMAFGYTAEDVEMIIEPMASTGKEPTFCMGDDAPLAVLSDKPHLLYDYFKQRFAQVTNPAIDPLRESLVMSLEMGLGPRGNLLQPRPEDARQLWLRSPVLNEAELEAIQASEFRTVTLSTLFDITPADALRQAVQALCDQAVAAVQQGAEILILSDRAEPLTATRTWIPPLLAVGAVHHHLIAQGLRLRASLVVDTAQCWSTHHFACLIGYGASAVCPYLAWETVRHWCQDPKTQTLMAQGKLSRCTVAEAQANYRAAVEAGLLKILSKMGISLLASYHGAQIFEILGLGPEVVDLAFQGTVSQLGGLNLAELTQEIVRFHRQAFPELIHKRLENWGFIQARPRGEYHMNSPEMAKLLHKAVRSGRSEDFAAYLQLLEHRPPTAPRDLLTIVSDRAPIPLTEVEPASQIVTRFCTGGMSLGALSREAHEVLAIAMNRLGGKSNSGEGGEDPVRFRVLMDVDESGHSPTLPHLKGLRNGDTASSAIKQVASGRFGVTPEYLIQAQQLEIKIAQGAKPGEGGQLPGKKVSPYIAMLRRSKPGVTLISPPPHHDIYSIEDLAQLIFDLHQVNPRAQVSVKLVAEIGIGTIAAGVAKANADVIQISGHDGGTGASPLSSIKHAGTPWELGLTEVHRVLLNNRLRDRVILRVDGGLKTGWDVVMAALMGAEEFGFGSVAMIAAGCIMARVCHTNNCPVGVATQREDLRARFSGLPEHVVNFFLFVAEEVRGLLAQMGYRSLADIVGRADLLQPRAVTLTKTQGLTTAVLTQLPDTRTDRSWLQHEPVHSNGLVLEDQLLARPDLQQAIRTHGSLTLTLPIRNTDRSVGARLAGEIARLHGDDGFRGQITLQFRGSAGQSFGAFNLPGMILHLTGEANDYVGKGMHGGEIIVVPDPELACDPSAQVIIGNTCLYGATGGRLFAYGRAGERFAVRNSLAQAVIEGAGDHCCEYMTGGVVVVLGPVGRNVGAGMTGGLAYILDETGDLPAKVNQEIVKIQRVTSPLGERQLRSLIAAHHERTGSRKAERILVQWERYLPLFWQVVPPSEQDTPEVRCETPVPLLERV
ncbi:MAG: glutamate synthase large subunit [Gloeomargarita sp. SKYBB_i_bin120]|nr:glutamate synthase large subunit [Gloeomargarita sp. SKYG98]MCS7291536.1 glutamate synthase large subunit [Gloeomargarita sp. SKYB120]MDW8177096.1 glutamate synthase large subunit [Gloeomargarita sp. SKYBB_i_bin120]